MADKRAFFKMDVGYLSNPKVVDVLDESPLAVVLHVASVAYAAQHLTDGVVPVKVVRRGTGATQDDVDLLLGAGLWHRIDDRTIEVHDYLEHNRSAEQAKGASEKAKRAANARHHGAAGKRAAGASSSAGGSASSTSKTRKATQLPAGWTCTDEHAKRAREAGLDLARELVKFRAHAEERARTAVSWNAAFTRWLTNAAEYAARDGRTPAGQAPARSGWGKGVPTDPYGLGGDR